MSSMLRFDQYKNDKSKLNFTPWTFNAGHALASPYVWSWNFSNVYTSLLCTFSPLSRPSSSPERRIKTSRSSEARNHICLPAVVYVSDPALTSDFELLQNTSESCMESSRFSLLLLFFFFQTQSIRKTLSHSCKKLKAGISPPTAPSLGGKCERPRRWETLTVLPRLWWG